MSIVLPAVDLAKHCRNLLDADESRPDIISINISSSNSSGSFPEIADLESVCTSLKMRNSPRWIFMI